MSDEMKSCAGVLLAFVLVPMAGACSGLDCPKGYDLRDEKCYRIRDAGQDGGDTVDDGGEAAATEFDDAATDHVVAAHGPCGDGCSAHANCDVENRLCECDPGYVETDAACVRDPCSGRWDVMSRATVPLTALI